MASRHRPILIHPRVLYKVWQWLIFASLIFDTIAAMLRIKRKERSKTICPLILAHVVIAHIVIAFRRHFEAVRFD